MAGRMYLGNQMVTPAIASIVESVNGQTGDVVLDASDVGALPDTTRYAKTLGLSMNTTTYVLSWQLYDQNGDAIGDVQTVDLPLESVVVNGTYDNANKKIILTLQNGSTIDVPVGDLVSGLQSEITITNKLSSDLVDDTNHTHKFVTAEEKTTWNNKQNAINDLATIRSGAVLGATSVQPSAIANMQTTDNMVQEVRASASAETTKYPSEKAVASKVDGLTTQIAREQSTRIAMDNSLSDRIDDLDEYVSDSLDSFVRTTDTIPITDYSLLDVPVQYKGSTTQDYTNGYFYRSTNPIYSSTVNITTGSFTVTVDNAKFMSGLLKTGSHRFYRKDSYYWYNSTLGEVHNLSYYGITITGTVNTGDKFYVNISMDTDVTRIDVQPAGGGAVDSVNGQTGAVVLDASDVDALPDSTVIPTDTADLTNGAGFITSSALSDYATEQWVGQQGFITLSSLSGTSPISYNSNTGAISVASGYQITTTAQVTQIGTNTTNITTINSKIPNDASSSNQLADKNFVNSSISSNTANFIGTFNSVADLEAYSGTLTNNDYAFVISQDTSGNTVYNRYKWNGTEWLFEYALNNSSFTADQWASINSTATASKISQIATNTSDISALQSGKQDNITGAATTITSSNLTVNRALVSNSSGKVGVSSVTATELGYLSGVTSAIQTQLNGKQATISDLATIRSGASAGATALQSGDNISELNNDSGYITGITSSMVTTALGYTPYSSSNPDGYLQNTATGTGSLTILGTANTNGYGVNIGTGSSAGQFGTAVGYGSLTSNNGVAIGQYAKANANLAIQIGRGTNTEANSCYIGLSATLNYKLLGSDGKIPDGRLPIASSVSSSSTNAEVVGAKLFYDTCGDIETLINAL